MKEDLIIAWPVPACTQHQLYIAYCRCNFLVKLYFVYVSLANNSWCNITVFDLTATLGDGVKRCYNMHKKFSCSRPTHCRCILPIGETAAVNPLFGESLPHLSSTSLHSISLLYLLLFRRQANILIFLILLINQKNKLKRKKKSP